MSGRNIGLSLAMVITAVVAQTAVFGQGRINPFGASPAIVLVIVLACVRYIEPEPALLLGFTAGLLLDLLGGSPLGLWAMAYTLVTYVGIRFRHRADDGPVIVGTGVLLLTLLSNALFLVVGTLFGERFLASSVVIKNTILPAAYNLLLAAVLFPAVTRLIGTRRRVGWSA